MTSKSLSFLIFVYAVLFIAFASTAPVNAQKQAKTIAPKTATLAEINRNIRPTDLSTLFFVEQEYKALQDARNARGKVRPLDEREVREELPAPVDLSAIPKPPPEQRELRLGGILYKSRNDWVIWLNEKRITPSAIPPEVLDLQVKESFIEVKWLDEWSGQIFPIRLKPHQRFNLDTRIFLPG